MAWEFGIAHIQHIVGRQHRQHAGGASGDGGGVDIGMQFLADVEAAFVFSALSVN